MLVFLVLALAAPREVSPVKTLPGEAATTESVVDPADHAREPTIARWSARQNEATPSRHPRASSAAGEPRLPTHQMEHRERFFTHDVTADVDGERIHARVISSLPLAVPAWMMAIAAIPLLPLTVTTGAVVGGILLVIDIKSGSFTFLSPLIPVAFAVIGATWPFAAAIFFHTQLSNETATRAAAKLNQRIRERRADVVRHG